MQSWNTSHHLHCCHHLGLIIISYVDLRKRLLFRTPAVYTFASNSLSRHSSWNHPSGMCQIILIFCPSPTLTPLSLSNSQTRPCFVWPYYFFDLICFLWFPVFTFLLFFKQPRHALDSWPLHLLFLLLQISFTSFKSAQNLSCQLSLL